MVAQARPSASGRAGTGPVAVAPGQRATSCMANYNDEQTQCYESPNLVSVTTTITSADLVYTTIPMPPARQAATLDGEAVEERKGCRSWRSSLCGVHVEDSRGADERGAEAQWRAVTTWGLRAERNRIRLTGIVEGSDRIGDGS